VMGKNDISELSMKDLVSVAKIDTKQ